MSSKYDKLATHLQTCACLHIADKCYAGCYQLKAPPLPSTFQPNYLSYILFLSISSSSILWISVFDKCVESYCDVCDMLYQAIFIFFLSEAHNKCSGLLAMGLPSVIESSSLTIILTRNLSIQFMNGHWAVWACHLGIILVRQWSYLCVRCQVDKKLFQVYYSESRTVLEYPVNHLVSGCSRNVLTHDEKCLQIFTNGCHICCPFINSVKSDMHDLNVLSSWFVLQHCDKNCHILLQNISFQQCEAKRHGAWCRSQSNVHRPTEGFVRMSAALSDDSLSKSSAGFRLDS